MFKIGLFCLVHFILFSLPSHTQELASSDIVLIKQRMANHLSQNPPKENVVMDIMEAMKPDGSWPGIDYYSIQVANWPPIDHLREFIMPMTRAYANVDSPLYKDTALSNALHLSLGYWLDHNFTSQNWWYNDIGVPMDLTNILIMMDDEITLEEFLKATNQMRGSYVIQTGQNKVWRAEIRFKIGLIQYGRGRGNLLGPPPKKMEAMVEILKSEVVLRDKEGIQPDWSFHQHGVQQQFGTYGLSYVSTQSLWAYLLKDTPYEYSEEQIRILRNYIMEGLSRVLWKGRMDISGMGRQIRPGNQEERTEIAMKALQLMIKADPTHSDVYKSVLKFNSGSPSATPVPAGNYYFWRSAMVAHRMDQYFCSVRMCSRKIQSTESGNGENLLAAHLSDGATYLYKTGKEYHNIFPVWDWHRIPGTTAYAEGPLPEVGWRGLLNENDFVGGLSNGDHGVATMLYQRNGLSAHKSWFFMPDGIVCLGAGINSLEDMTVATTIDQRLLQGDVRAGANGHEAVLEEGQEKSAQDLDWIYHNGIGYLFLQGQNVHVNTAVKNGNWQRIYENGTSETKSKSVFDVWIDHGNAPRDASYAYMVLPVMDDKECLMKQTSNPRINVLVNSSSKQVIYDKDRALLQAVFYKSGSIAMEDSKTISADHPCIMMVQEVPTGVEISLAVPPELDNEIIITLSGKYSGEGVNYDKQKNETSVKFNLPDGIFAGKSVTKTFSK